LFGLGYGDNFYIFVWSFLKNGFITQRSKSEAFERIARLALYLLIILDMTSNSYIQESKSNFDHTYILYILLHRCLRFKSSCGLIALIDKGVPSSVCAAVACCIARNDEHAQLINSQHHICSFEH